MINLVNNSHLSNITYSLVYSLLSFLELLKIFHIKERIRPRIRGERSQFKGKKFSREKLHTPGERFDNVHPWHVRRKIPRFIPNQGIGSSRLPPRHCSQTHENICNPFSRANFPLMAGPPVKNPRAPLVER